jgi:hypothetical protein
MKKIIIWLAKVFHMELPKAEVIKEYKWIPLDGKITGNVVIEGDVLIKGIDMEFTVIPKSDLGEIFSPEEISEMRHSVDGKNNNAAL